MTTTKSREPRAELDTPPSSLQQLEGEPLVIGDKEFHSRLIVGTGKYASPGVMVEAIRASGAEMVDGRGKAG